MYALQSPDSCGRSGSRLVRSETRTKMERAQPIATLSDFRRLSLSLAATCETVVRRQPWCLLLFFRRFRNTTRHLIFFFFFYDVHCDGPDLSRCAGFLMMPGLDWIMSSPCISPRKPSFMCESLFL